MNVTPIALIAALLALAAGPIRAPDPASAPPVCRECLTARIDRLTSPSLQGRECGTPDEGAAATLLAQEMRQAGLLPGAEGARYVQPVDIDLVRYVTPPVLRLDALSLVYGEDFLASNPLRSLRGRFIRLSALDADALRQVNGATVLFTPPKAPSADELAKLQDAGALLILLRAPDDVLDAWPVFKDDPAARRLPGAAQPPERRPLVFLRPAALAKVLAASAKTLRIEARTRTTRSRTQNLIGVIPGQGPNLDRGALLLSAHYDHLGVRGGVPYPGANDDASGVAAVLEFARLFAHGPPPGRTIYVAFFGCEEAGGFGAAYFADHPPLRRLSDFAAAIGFEMIGFPDPKLPDNLMLTGWERSTLGPLLVGFGARLEKDPYPESDYFRRSDNFQLAKRGVVAQTISAWPSPPTYHRPTDTATSLDPAYLSECVRSLFGPLQRLASGPENPAWRPGQSP